jgi:hypothetical protein
MLAQQSDQEDTRDERSDDPVVSYAGHGKGDAAVYTPPCLTFMIRNGKAFLRPHDLHTSAAFELGGFLQSHSWREGNVMIPWRRTRVERAERHLCASSHWSILYTLGLHPTLRTVYYKHVTHTSTVSARFYLNLCKTSAIFSLTPCLPSYFSSKFDTTSSPFLPPASLRISSSRGNPIHA